MTENLPIDQKIKNEKRRRVQLYTALDYLLSALTYFDFFSFDAFNIVKYSKFLADSLNQDLVTGEFLVLSYFYSKNQVIPILKSLGISEKEFLTLSLVRKKEEKFPNSFPFFRQVKEFLFSKKKRKNIEFSREVHLIFEKAAENALTRFKTPVISSEILFITIMEQKETKVALMMKKLLKSETNWYLFRYELIKRIHYHEGSIRNEISINQQYFAYLLKTQLTDTQFDTLIQENLLETSVFLFRNTIISEILKENIFELLSKEINQSIKLTRFRSFSS